MSRRTVSLLERRQIFDQIADFSSRHVLRDVRRHAALAFRAIIDVVLSDRGDGSLRRDQLDNVIGFFFDDSAVDFSINELLVVPI